MLFEHILDFVYPPVCAVCSKRLVKKTAFSGFDAKELCANCSISSSPLLIGESLACIDTENACRCCGELEPIAGPAPDVCLYCYLWPLAAREVRSLWHYQTQVEELVKAYKYRSKTHLAALIVRAMSEAIASGKLFSNSDWDIVVALPSTPSATRSRGFAHTSFIARKLAAQLKLPWKADLLSMNPQQAQQTSVPFAERFINMRNAFNVPSTSACNELQNKTVLLVDDVITTGASSMNAATALLDAGCKVVDIYTVCRSVNFYKRRLSLVRSLSKGAHASK